MRFIALLTSLTLAFALPTASAAEVKVTAERNSTEAPFHFKSVPLPAQNDAAAKAQFKLIDGQRDGNGAELAVLHDGRVPSNEDQPVQNFFFRAGSEGGRLAVDLGSVISVKQVNSYSWHAGVRAPQVYKLYAAAGSENGFNAEPKKGIDPESCGWKMLASADSRRAGEEGQHGVMISAGNSPLGKWRHLLFEIARTDDSDPFGQTFFSEIDVIDSEATNLVTIAAAKPVTKSFGTGDGKFRFTIDATAAPDLLEWAEKELHPVIRDWYPKLVAMLPSEGFQARTNVTFRFRNDMGGTPASASGDRVNMNSDWFRKELKREARGSVVHEMVHIVQSYQQRRRDNPNATRTPGWIVEGIPDYIRWFLYEPETKGAEITERNLERAKFDASYRVSGNFLNWVTEKYDRQIVRKINAASREGKYSEELWKEHTGKSLQELGDEWKKGHEERLSKSTAAPASQPVSP